MYNLKVDSYPGSYNFISYEIDYLKSEISFISKDSLSVTQSLKEIRKIKNNTINLEGYYYFSSVLLLSINTLIYERNKQVISKLNWSNLFPDGKKVWFSPVSLKTISLENKENDVNIPLIANLLSMAAYGAFRPDHPKFHRYFHVFKNFYRGESFSKDLLNYSYNNFEKDINLKLIDNIGFVVKCSKIKDRISYNLNLKSYEDI